MCGDAGDAPEPGIEFLESLSEQDRGQAEPLEIVDAEVLEPADIQFVEPPRPLLTIDVCGARGADGRDGLSYSGQTARRGGDGRAGGDATDAASGQHAGDIKLWLSSPVPGSVRVSGRRALPSGQTLLVEDTLSIGQQGHIRLIADGGRGGDGGDGGDGEDGGRGHDGADASRWSSGEDGGPGGDGGDGGNGTSGGNGGNGGQVMVGVDQQDTHLLMLVSYRVQPGSGGQPGRNGSGGAGGLGGSGGSSYSWTTWETESYYSDGEWKTRTVTKHHRNSGGWNGRSGNRGRDGNATLRAGSEGQPGSFRILVQHGEQRAQYKRRYDLELVDYELALTDQFAEPSSRIELRRLSLRNSGGMPTPRQPIIIRLTGSRWVVPEGPPLELTRSLRPGEEYTFEQQVLAARIAEVPEVPVGDPLHDTDQVAPQALQSAADRLYPRFQQPRQFPIAFPAEIQAVRSLVSQTPGQAALLRVTIRNTSQQDLGRQSESRRRLGVRLTLLNSERANDVMLLDLQGRPCSWDMGWEQDLPLLEAGASTTVEAVVGVLPGAPGYCHADLAATLQIGDLKQFDQPLDRHQRNFRLRIAQAYEFDASADILFIANHGTTAAERQAWEQATARLGKRINIWDISLEDTLALSERLHHGESLLRDFHGKTIVLSNAVFQTVLGPRHGDQYVSQVDLIRALESHQIRLLVLNEHGRDVSPLLQERLVPTDGVAEYRYPSIKSFLRGSAPGEVDALLTHIEELVQRKKKAARPDPLQQTSEIAIYGVLSPNRRRLRRQAIRLQRKLENESPGKRFVVTYRLPPATADEPPAESTLSTHAQQRGGFFFTHVRQGTLTVMPTVGDAQPSIIVLPASFEELHAPEFIGSPKVLAALVQALAFRDKVYLLDSQLREPADREQPGNSTDHELGRALVDAILMDLAVEQAAILGGGWKPLLRGNVIREGLSQLQFLSEYPFPLTERDSERPAAQLAARLIAGIQFLGWTQCGWYERRFWPWSFWRRAPVLRRQTLGCAEKLTRYVFGEADRKGTRQLTRKPYQTFHRRLRHLRSQRRLRKKQAAREVLFWPLTRHGMFSDVQGVMPRVLEHDQWQAVQEAERKREADRRALQQAKQESRTEYLVANDGQPLRGQPVQLAAAAQVFAAACAKRRGEAEMAVSQPALLAAIPAPGGSGGKLSRTQLSDADRLSGDRELRQRN